MRGKILFLAALLLWPAAAPANVTLTFYSRELGSISRTLSSASPARFNAASDTVIETNYGFTAKTVSPAVLVGAVAGEILAATRPTFAAATAISRWC